MHNSRDILIGLAGFPSSGKDTVAAYLVGTQGFVHISTSDAIRFYIAEHELGEIDRDNMRMVGTQLREEHGADYLARLSLLNPAPRLIVSGLRAVAEAKAIKDAGGIILVCTAPIEVRYHRVTERNRTGDEVSFEKFKAQEEAEASNPNPEAQNISAVVAMADYTINNISSLEDLHTQVDEVMKKISHSSKS